MYLIVVLKKNILGILIAEFIATSIITACAIFNIRKDIKFQFSLTRLKELLHFGLPLVPANLGIIIVNGSDRYFLKYFSNLQEVGLYALGYRIASVVVLAIGAFQLSWGPFLFSIEKEKNAQDIYSRVLTYFLFTVGLLTLGLSIFAKEIVMFLSTPDYYGAYRVVPIIALAYLLYGAYFAVSIGINLKNKTIYFPLVLGLAAVLNLILNYLFIPKYGMMGAAVATLISYFFIALGIYWVSVKYYSINYEWLRIGKITFVWSGLYIAASVFKFKTLPETLFFKSLLAAAYPFLLFLTGFFTRGEIIKLKQIVTKIISRK
jgi:O-antigen/teichoic acid export membrane protein